MKRLLIYLCAVSILASCIKLPDIDVSGESQEAKAALLAEFSSANIKNWDSRLGYVVVNFTLDVENGTPANCVAWYDRNGKWYLTESSMKYQELPAAVTAAFEGGDFKDCNIEEVYCLDAPEFTEYAMLITGKIYGYAQRGFLYYKENGTLHISIVNPRSDYTYGDYLLAPICKKGDGSNTDSTPLEN